MLLALAACDRGADDRAATDANIALGNDTANTDAAESAGEAVAPQAFVDNAAASDLYEIQAGTLAAEKARNADVKAFAQMLVADHTRSSTELKTAAAQSDPAVTPPTTLPADKQAKIDALKAATGADFDRLFLTQQVEAHSAALDLLRGYASGGTSEPLKAFAGKAAPIVEAHLQKAQQLQR
jgi:putative membrane protein